MVSLQTCETTRSNWRSKLKYDNPIAGERALAGQCEAAIRGFYAMPPFWQILRQKRKIYG